VPEGTHVSIATFSLQRDQRYFSSPTTFIPERWLPDYCADSPKSKTTSVSLAERRHVPEAFIPFSAGPANCIGKNLAYQEMRMLLCYVLKYFDLELAANSMESVDAWEAGMKDYLMLIRKPLSVVVRRRGSPDR
jgi:cytochrome P450